MASLLSLPKDIIHCLCTYKGVMFKLLLTCKYMKQRVRDRLYHLYLTTPFTRRQLRDYIDMTINRVVNGEQVEYPIYFLIREGKYNVIYPALHTVSFMTDVRTEVEGNVYTPIKATRHYKNIIAKKMEEVDLINTQSSFCVQYDNLEGRPHLSSLKIGQSLEHNLGCNIITVTVDDSKPVVVDVRTYSHLLATRGSFKYTDEERLQLAKDYYSSSHPVLPLSLEPRYQEITKPQPIPKSKIIEVETPMIMNPDFTIFPSL